MQILFTSLKRRSNLTLVIHKKHTYPSNDHCKNWTRSVKKLGDQVQLGISLPTLHPLLVIWLYCVSHKAQLIKGWIKLSSGQNNPAFQQLSLVYVPYNSAPLHPSTRPITPWGFWFKARSTSTPTHPLPPKKGHRALYVWLV